MKGITNKNEKEKTSLIVDDEQQNQTKEMERRKNYYTERQDY